MSLAARPARLSGHLRKRLRKLAPGFYGRGPVTQRGRPRLWVSEHWADAVLMKVRLDMMAGADELFRLR